MGEQQDERTFEEIVAELEATAQKMASGEIGIERAAELYERAGQLHAEAAARLDAVRARLAALVDDDGGEGPATRPG